MTMKTILHRSKSPWLLLPFFVLLAAALLTFWFFHHFEKKEYTITTGSAPQVKNNPLLAAQEYLQQTGYHSESVKGLDLLTKLPPVRDAMIIRYLPSGLNNTINTNLLSWVERGGHLLVQANGNSLKSDHPGKVTIFEKLGVGILEDENCGCEKNDTKPEANKSDDEAQDTEIDIPEPSPQKGPRHHLIRTDLDGTAVQIKTRYPDLLVDNSNSALLTIEGSYFLDYEDSEDRQRSDQGDYIERDGAWLLQYQLGKGKVTVLSEMFLFTNSYIGDYDHAYLLSWLTRDAASIWLLYSSEIDSFLTILWKKAPQFWIAFFILILLIIWRMQMQSGTQKQPALDERHNIMYHIDATAQYNWRTNTFSSMVNHNRKVVWNMLVGRKMGVQAGQKNTDIDISKLAQKSGMTQQQLHTAFQQTVETEQDLIQISNYLQRVNMHMSGGENKEK